jgi:hypothetical protein
MPSLSDNVTELPIEFIERVDALRSNLVVFSVMRSERQRIPAWLRHYREIGVKTFAIVDNNSTDGTYELLTCEKDVVLTRMAGGFLASRFGVDWLNEFHRRIRPGTWVLFVDADEFLVYRGWPETDLATYANWMTAEGSNAAMGFMLDMYPVGPIENATIVDSDDLFTVAGNFDRHYHFRVAPRKPWETGNGHLEVIGGPRVRLLSSFEKEISTTWWSYFIRGQIDRILPIVPDRFLGLLIRIMPKQMPYLHKTPLVLGGSGFSYTNNHGGTGGRVFRENVVLCHFKFLADFAARVRQEINRGEHFRRGAEYIMYRDAMARSNNLVFTYPGSQRFDGAESLIRLGLIRDIRAFLPSNGSA